MDSADGLVYRLECAPTGRRPCDVVADEEKQVDGMRRVHGLLEPVLLHHLCRIDHLGGVGVACEIE